MEKVIFLGGEMREKLKIQVVERSFTCNNSVLECDLSPFALHQH
jgi:hypothetical protein